MKNSYDQKKGSADRDLTGSKKGMPGGNIGRDSMASSHQSSSHSRNAGSKSEDGDSRGRKGSPSQSSDS
jgi:hypothetical protein